ncbi:3-phosphoshikimate 1-carboxyvinyltransferase [Candidatus Gracilibacteria bacterium]|nr:3-phosphoshikimate 1-carboxyvinyltransferase [Candidatus Gracilibacteria bacterium]NUJ98938.1 3-phosphoshikimate 1-carboxyvinyltransferase [Candidatus Gracilibacteria bacterium]
MQTIHLPGSKSISNRDFILASLVRGVTILEGILLSDDTQSMINALKNIGIEIVFKGNTTTIHGGIEKIRGDNKELYLGQSGTCMRFLTAFAILNKVGTITLTGEQRLLQRPMGDLLDALKQLGVQFESNGDYPPIKIYPSELTTNKIEMNGTISSQFFTAFLQIAPFFEKGLEIEVLGDLVSKPYIDITINEIKKFGGEVINENYKKFIVPPGKYNAQKLVVEGDASALSYIACFYALHGGKIKIGNLGSDTKQGDYKFLKVMKIFGLEFESDGETTIIQAPGIKNIDLSQYRDYQIDFENMPDVSLSFMIMSLFLPGNTYITGLQTLNLKESKRIDAMKNELKKIGVQVQSDEKSIEIGEITASSPLAPLLKREGKTEKGETINIETYNDHRIAMCFGILETYIGNLNILNPNCVNKTYPNFWKDLKIMNNK